MTPEPKAERSRPRHTGNSPVGGGRSWCRRCSGGNPGDGETRQAGQACTRWEWAAGPGNVGLLGRGNVVFRG